MTSFFICDDDWEKETEITLEDMGSGSSEEDTYIMRETPLSELLEDEKQKMIYVFDPLAERVFFIELQKSSQEKIWTRQYALVKMEKLLNRPSILMNR